MKEFIVGFIVGGYLMDNFYPRLSNFCGYKSILTPAGYYSRLFNNLKWKRKEHVEEAIKEIENFASVHGYITIAQMLDLFKVDDVYLKPNYSNIKYMDYSLSSQYSRYAHSNGLTVDDISKLKPLKSVTKGGYRMDFNDGIRDYYDHFACIKPYYDNFEGAYEEPNDETYEDNEEETKETDV